MQTLIAAGHADPEGGGSCRPAAVRRSQTRVGRCAKRDHRQSAGCVALRDRNACVFSGEIALGSVIRVDLPFCFGTAEEEGKAEWAQRDPLGGWDDDGWFACRFGCRSERRGAKRIAVPKASRCAERVAARAGKRSIESNYIPPGL